MARKRMIDPNFWQSEEVSRMSVFARLLFLGLVSNADDEGRGRANPVYLRSTVFPYDDLEADKVAEALAEISRHTSTLVYEVDGNHFFCLRSWRRWQKLDRPQKSVLPSPKEGVLRYEPRIRRGEGDDSTNARRSLDDCSTNARRSRGDGSTPIEEKGREDRREKNGVERAVRLPMEWGKTYKLAADDISHLKTLYKDVDVEAELGKMVGWLEANPTKRKPLSEAPAFVARWLGKASDDLRVVLAESEAAKKEDELYSRFGPTQFRDPVAGREVEEVRS